MNRIYKKNVWFKWYDRRLKIQQQKMKIHWKIPRLKVQLDKWKYLCMDRDVLN